MTNTLPTSPEQPVPAQVPPYDGRHWSLAAKLEHHGHLWDASLSFYEGYDPAPELRLRPRPHFRFPRVGVFGFDFALPTGSVAWRGESAWFRFRGSPEKLDRLFSILGAERTWSGHLMTGFQIIHIRAIGFPPGRGMGQGPGLGPESISAFQLQDVFNGQSEKDTHGFTLRISKPFMNEDLNLSTVLVANLTRRDYLSQLKVEYSLVHGWKAVCKADLYGGKEMSLFGRLRKNSALHLEMYHPF